MSQPNQTVALALLAVTTIACLAGCANRSPGGTPPHTVPPLSGIVATGSLVGVGQSDPITGNVTVLANPLNGALTVRITGLTGNVRSAAAAELSAPRVTPGSSCAPYGVTYSNGALSTKANQQFVLPSDKTPGWANPSFLHSVILTSAEPSATGCVGAMAAYAQLTWTIRDPRPDIHVHDRGTRQGAEGLAVTIDGTPAAYKVVSGDNLDTIANRFGLTLNDLFYLNPARTPSPVSTVTEVGERLNLSKANR